MKTLGGETLGVTFTDEIIDSKITLTIIEIDMLDSCLTQLLDENFVFICEGNSGTDLITEKKLVKELYSSKDDNWIMGATAEFFVHLFVKISGFKQECLFLNLEEGSIKKGFDGFYSKNSCKWLMESKSGSISSKGISHSEKIKLAMKDLEDKVLGKASNNPWRNAYSHASHYDVGTSEDIRKSIKKLSDDYTCGCFYKIDDFNTMPCGTIFLSGIWTPPTHNGIINEIKGISGSLKGTQVHCICVTQRTVKLFLDYIN